MGGSCRVSVRSGPGPLPLAAAGGLAWKSRWRAPRCGSERTENLSAGRRGTLRVSVSWITITIKSLSPARDHATWDHRRRISGT
eukprot:2760656-Rhodomonas_salina.1